MGFPINIVCTYKFSNSEIYITYYPTLPYSQLVRVSRPYTTHATWVPSLWTLYSDTRWLRKSCTLPWYDRSMLPSTNRTKFCGLPHARTEARKKKKKKKYKFQIKIYTIYNAYLHCASVFGITIKPEIK